MPVKTAPKASVQDDRKAVHDQIFESFDADRRKMNIGPTVTRQQRDEKFYRAGFAAGKASQITSVVDEVRRQCTASSAD